MTAARTSAAAANLPSRTTPPARASGTTIASAEQLGGRDDLGGGHTPGPWRAARWTDNECQVLAGGKTHVTGFALNADARLIAAAPELLAVIEEALGTLGPDGYLLPCGANVTGKMRRAVAKARGEAA